MITNNNWYKTNRLAGLRRFAIAITILNLLGHTILGFEQSWAQPLIALVTAYSTELILEIIDAKLNQRPQHFAGGLQNFIDFLLPAHITGLAVAMLLYANDQLFPIAFATATAIGSKAIFRAPVNKGTRHFLNPSNFGITFTLLLFPWVGIAPPYQFTENLDGIADWILPIIIVISGTFLNAKFTQRLPLIAAWVGGFIIQAFLRSLIFGTPITAALMPITSVGFVLFTFYMVTDPGTSPIKPKDQVIFGAAVAAGYGILMLSHIVFGFFFSLTAVCLLRGLILYSQAWTAKTTAARVTIPTPATVAEI
ncbi:MAG TPA: enediyne biosynthesis protein UnbU [Cyanobacteria bacterium UBA11370]|nr:enediyne biosynthesis protein UnbU [Cyanobacteria bacterium UBA11370]HBY77211.1 enediyne biosynthesis protein UnbU [Cyanobacteria bacterium UBA11148]